MQNIENPNEVDKIMHEMEILKVFKCLHDYSAQF